MTMLFLVFALLLLLAPLSTQAAPLYSAQVITVLGPCSKTEPNRATSWTNTTQHTLYIKQADMWMGMTKGALADMYGNLYRMSDWSFVIGMGWDHYKDPVAPVHQLMNFAPDSMVLAPGDSLYLISGCVPFKSRINYLHTVTVWWSMEE